MRAPVAVPAVREDPNGPRTAAPASWGVGVVVGSRAVHVAAIDDRGLVRREDRIDLHADLSDLEPLWELVADVLTGLADTATESSSTLEGLTVALPGVVDSRGGLLHDPSGVRAPVKAQEQLGRRLPPERPRVRLVGRGPLAATIEAGLTSDRAAGVLCHLSAEGDVAFGVAAQGRALTGAVGLAGQVGHLPLDPLGHECTCSRRGCWTTVISLPALLRRATDPDDPVRDPTLAVEAQTAEIERRARLDDDRTRSALAETGHALGLGLAVLGQVLTPDVVVLDGYLGRLLTYLLPACESAHRLHGPHRDGQPCRFEPAVVDDRDMVLGAASRALTPTDHALPTPWVMARTEGR